MSAVSHFDQLIGSNSQNAMQEHVKSMKSIDCVTALCEIAVALSLKGQKGSNRQRQIKHIFLQEASKAVLIELVKKCAFKGENALTLVSNMLAPYRKYDKLIVVNVSQEDYKHMRWDYAAQMAARLDEQRDSDDSN